MRSVARRGCIGDTRASASGSETCTRRSPSSTSSNLEVRDLSERIVGIGRIRMRERDSGVETESPLVSVTHVNNGKGIRVWNYLNPEEVPEAAGLRG
jgi:hypothetical protein